MQTLATLAADPVASLVDTAYLGRYGMPLSGFSNNSLVTEAHEIFRTSISVQDTMVLIILALCAGSSELAAVGVALSIFGTVTKLLNIPLLSVTTNIVATAVGSKKGG